MEEFADNNCPNEDSLSENQDQATGRKEIPNECPWLDEAGNLRSDKEITELGKEWAWETWDRYLQTLESSQKEDQMEDYELFNYLAERIQISERFKEIEDFNYDFLKKYLKEALKDLTFKQGKIIHEIFWENKSERDLGKEMNLSHKTVHYHKMAAIARIQRNLFKEIANKKQSLKSKKQGGKPGDFPISEGEKNNNHGSENENKHKTA